MLEFSEDMVRRSYSLAPKLALPDLLSHSVHNSDRSTAEFAEDSSCTRLCPRPSTGALDSSQRTKRISYSRRTFPDTARRTCALPDSSTLRRFNIFSTSRARPRSALRPDTSRRIPPPSATSTAARRQFPLRSSDKLPSSILEWLAPNFCSPRSARAPSRPPGTRLHNNRPTRRRPHLSRFYKRHKPCPRARSDAPPGKLERSSRSARPRTRRPPQLSRPSNAPRARPEFRCLSPCTADKYYFRRVPPDTS